MTSFKNNAAPPRRADRAGFRLLYPITIHAGDVFFKHRFEKPQVECYINVLRFSGSFSACPRIHHSRFHPQRRRHGLFFSDELCAEVEQVSPVAVLTETAVNVRSNPQAHLADMPRGSRIAASVPGRKPECTRDPGFVADVTAMIHG